MRKASLPMLALVLLGLLLAAPLRCLAFPDEVGLVKHVVVFRFGPDVTPEVRSNVLVRYMVLHNLCVLPDNATTTSTSTSKATPQRYIVEQLGGFNTSGEGQDRNMTQGYIVTFRSVADRDYFVGRPFHQPYDPLHDAFKAYVGPLLDGTDPKTGGVFVFDFVVKPHPVPPPPPPPPPHQVRRRLGAPGDDLPPSQQGLAKHFVAFRFLASVTPEQQLQVAERFTLLQTLCVRPDTGLPYILSLVYGLANSPEGQDRNMTQGYIVTFYGEADKEYYVWEDPQHQSFKAFVGPLLDGTDPKTGGVFVFDFDVI